MDLSTETLESSTPVSRSIRLVLSYPFYHSFYEARGGLGRLYFFFRISTSSLPGCFILGVSFLPCETAGPYNVLHEARLTAGASFATHCSSDKRVQNSFEHKHHGWCKVRIRMSDTIKSFILENGASSSPASIADSIFTTFKVHISESRIIWHLRKNDIRTSRHVNRIQYKAGSILASMQFSLMKECKVLTLLIHVDTGRWFTGKMALDAEKMSPQL